ncbi:DMT family transporter [Roseibium sp.]|uniref:DMT family transporter n=1 Tax=Roseibium sp. TaxID=1936156 RepID=UPI003A970C0A
MSVLASTTALAASGCWAVGAILAERPSRELGSFRITRIQLVSSAPPLALLVSWTGGWGTVSLSHWPALLSSTFLGVLLGNLAMMACLRRGGPRYMQLLMALSPVWALVLSNLYLGENISLTEASGCVVTMLGIIIAIFFRKREIQVTKLEKPGGSLMPVIGFGLIASFCQAVGFILLKPVMTDGMSPLATSFLRTGIAAVLIVFLGFLPIRGARTETVASLSLILRAVLPGLLGYVCAVSLLLFAFSQGHAGVVAVLGATAPVLMLPMLWLTGTGTIPWTAWVGAVVTTAGTAILITG